MREAYCVGNHKRKFVNMFGEVDRCPIEMRFSSIFLLIE